MFSFYPQIAGYKVHGLRFKVFRTPYTAHRIPFFIPHTAFRSSRAPQTVYRIPFFFTLYHSLSPKPFFIPHTIPFHRAPQTVYRIPFFFTHTILFHRTPLFIPRSVPFHRTPHTIPFHLIPFFIPFLYIFARLRELKTFPNKCRSRKRISPLFSV